MQLILSAMSRHATLLWLVVGISAMGLLPTAASQRIVSTLAGSGANGAADGSSTVASFSYPRGIAVDASFNSYIADSGNNKILRGGNKPLPDASPGGG